MPVEIGRRSVTSRATWLPEVGAQPQDGGWKAGASLITDHPHEVPVGTKTWQACKNCGLSEAAHAQTMAYGFLSWVA
jgi:hypothetical protein